MEEVANHKLSAGISGSVLSKDNASVSDEIAGDRSGNLLAAIDAGDKPCAVSCALCGV